MPGDYTYRAFKIAESVLPEHARLNINDYNLSDDYLKQVLDLMGVPPAAYWGHVTSASTVFTISLGLAKSCLFGVLAVKDFLVEGGGMTRFVILLIFSHNQNI